MTGGPGRLRVLGATTAGAGHLGPLVPFLHACRQAGHSVIVAAPASFAAAVERTGLVHRPFADGDETEQAAVFASLAGLSLDDANQRVIGEIFGRIDTGAALPGMQALVETWRPHVVVREATEYSSLLVAERSSVPSVQISIGLSWMEDLALPALDEPLDELRASIGLAPDPGLTGLRTTPRFSCLPPSLEDPSAPGGPGTSRFREGHPPSVKVLPDWWPGSDDPLVYVTFGSVAASLGLFPDLYRAVTHAVADLPVRVLLTTGDAGDPAALAPVPANVHVERWWPQDEVMPSVAAMVGHGGYGTTLLGLAAGVPMVVLPLFADQPYNARRVEAVGAGLALSGGMSAVTALPGALSRVLAEPEFAAGARRIAAEVATLPEVSEAVGLLEALARSG